MHIQRTDLNKDNVFHYSGPHIWEAAMLSVYDVDWRRRVVSAMILLPFMFCDRARIYGTETVLRVADHATAVHHVAAQSMQFPGVAQNWKAISLCANGEIVVWHDSDTGHLVFSDLKGIAHNDIVRPTFPIHNAPQKQVGYCLMSAERKRCAVVMSDRESIETAILRYPEMTVDASIEIDLKSDTLHYLAGAAIAPSGQHFAIASNHHVWILDETESGWRRRKAWSGNFRRWATLAWSPDDQLLAQGGHRNLDVARIYEDRVDPLPIHVVPRLTVFELAEHARRGTLEVAHMETLYQLHLRLCGVHSVGFIEKGRRLIVGGGCSDPQASKDDEIRPQSGFVAVWDTSTMRLLSCDIFPETLALEVHPSRDGTSYFVYVAGLHEPIGIEEIDLDSERILCIYRPLSDGDYLSHLRQFVVSHERRQLIAIDQAGRVAIWRVRSD